MAVVQVKVMSDPGSSVCVVEASRACTDGPGPNKISIAKTTLMIELAVFILLLLVLLNEWQRVVVPASCGNFSNFSCRRQQMGGEGRVKVV
jgi:hypothetical protein